MENHVYLQINDVCNQKCVFCNRPPENNTKTEEIPAKMVEKRIIELVEKGTKRVIFTGGEPTLRKDLCDLINFAKNNGVEIIELQTNAIDLSDENLVKKLKEAGLDKAYVAFHAHNKKLYDKIARCDSFFDKKIKGIENCIKNDLSVSVIHVIHELNYKYVKDFLEFMYEKFPEIDYYNLSIVVPEGHAFVNKWCVPKYSNLKPYLTEAVGFCKKNNIKFDVSEIVPLCMAEGFEDRVASTKFLFEGVTIVDDYYKDGTEKKLEFDNLKDIYAMKAPQCKNCSLYEICGGFNPNYAKIHGTDEFIPSKKDPQEIIKNIVSNGKKKKHKIDVENLKKRFYLALSEECNENCVFCVTKGDNVGKLGSMTTEETKEIIDQLAGHDICLQFTGGEPTIRDDLPEVIEYASKKGIPNFTIITNAVELANEDKLKKILNAADNKKINFSVSLHSHKKEISELLTGSKNTFEKTIKGMKNIINAGYNINLYHIITSKNCQDLEEFIEFIHTNFPEIKNITLSYVFPQGNAMKNKWVFPKLSKLKNHLYGAINLMKKYNMRFDFSSCGTFPLCYARGFEKIIINQLLTDEEEVSGMKSANFFHEFEMTKEDFEKNYKTKNEACSFCIFNKFCRGLWKEYSNLYGLDELKPILFSDKKNKIIEINKDDDIEKLLENVDKNTINLIDFKMNIKESKINRIIDILEKNDILYHFVKPIPQCFKIKNRNYIPSSCKDCLKLIPSKNDLCKKVHLNRPYFNFKEKKEKQLKLIRTNLEKTDNCKKCLYLIRKKCFGICKD